MELAMAQAVVRGLSVGAEVRVILDAEAGRASEAFSARIDSIYGSTARLAPTDQLRAELRARLMPGALGHLNFQRDDVPVALRGIAILHRYSGGLEFAISEGIRLTDRRTVNRAPFVAHLRASRMSDNGRVTGTTTAIATRNLSPGGALVERHPLLGNGPRWKIELTLPSEASPVQCEALLARETADHLALKFVGLPDTDRLRLAAALAGGAA